MRNYLLKLYVTSKSEQSDNVIDRLQEICESQIGVNNYSLIVIDVLDSPQLAEEDNIMATPTLIKHFPPPTTRIIGDLSDPVEVLAALGIDE